MKSKFTHILALLTITLCSLTSQAQVNGRVVINEYLPWPYTSCGSRAEFIELFNFGPGPVDISCYILTDGDFAIQIPAGTVIQPGQFWVAGGLSTIPYGCGNIAQATVVNLNWYTCGCVTPAPGIPTAAPALFTDGGFSQEQVVLLDPNLNIVDAVVRKLPQETSSNITVTSSCTGATTSFDLDNMPINYEVIGESDGRGNSMARKVDGDCTWVKDTQQSAGTTNNTGSDESSLTATLTVTEPYACPNTGAISIFISGNNSFLNEMFPMEYILARDVDEDGVYELTDSYINGTDATAPTIDIMGLVPGRYRIVISSALGCNLTQFDFVIVDCTILPFDVLEFIAEKNQSSHVNLRWKTEQTETIKTFEVEKSTNGVDFTTIHTLSTETSHRGIQQFNYTDESTPSNEASYYRIKMTGWSGQVQYSDIRKINFEAVKVLSIRAFPNPFTESLKVNIKTPVDKQMRLMLQDASGRRIREWNENLPAGESIVSVPVNGLASGSYLLTIYSGEQRLLTQKLQKIGK